MLQAVDAGEAEAAAATVERAAATESTADEQERGSRGASGCKRGRRGRRAAAEPDGPTLDATTIPKFVTPLVIPPVMRRTAECKLPQRLCPHRYEIALREFRQQILPGGAWNSTIWGILNETTLLRDDQVFNSTRVWGYGPAKDPKPDQTSLGGEDGVAPAANSQFNYPAYTIENLKDEPTSVQWINNLVKDPWACKWNRRKGPPPGYACNFAEHLLPVDQSLHWANPAKLTCSNATDREIDCRPVNVTDHTLAEQYVGPVPMVVHVHGAHATSDSDGYTEAWWMPTANNLHGFARTGTLVNRLGRRTNVRPGVANFRYQNDQPSAALWFHDHTLGLTRLNVYAGPAGFWLIRDRQGGETGLVKGILPYPAPQPGESLEKTNVKSRNKYREIPIVIQDRSFNKNGDLWYPRSRASFEGVSEDKLQVPLIGNSSVVSDISPRWNPEAFFDVMVVNGVSWPVLNVEPDLYRFRLLNGCDSRFLNLALCIIPPGEDLCELDENGKPSSGRELPFFQIGAEQSLLPKVVKVSTGSKTVLRGDGSLPQAERNASSPREALLMGPSERADVLVDFGKLDPGTVVRMINTGSDDPFGGFGDDFVIADVNTTGQVMEFRVIHDNLKYGERATSPEDLVLSLPDRQDPANRVSRSKSCKLSSTRSPWRRHPFWRCPAKSRDLALLEESSKLICATTEEDGTIVWDDTVVPDPNGTETCVPRPDATALAAIAASAARPLRRAARGPLDRSGTSLLDVGRRVEEPTPFGPTAVLLGIRGSSTSFEARLWEQPITERPKEGSTEIWEFWNWSEDAHPVHVHLVKFRVLQRVHFNTTTAEPGDEVLDVPTEAGWKDTVIAYPSQVTRVAATFDIAGLYVWHCHVLSHEDNEMMRPFCVQGKAKNTPGCDAVP